MSSTLQPCGLQHIRLPHPSLSPSLLRFMSIELMMLSNHLILCHPLLLLPSIFPHFRVFSNELTLCIRWPKDWRYSFVWLVQSCFGNDYLSKINIYVYKLWLVFIFSCQGILVSSNCWIHSCKGFCKSTLVTIYTVKWKLQDLVFVLNLRTPIFHFPPAFKLSNLSALIDG